LEHPRPNAHPRRHQRTRPRLARARRRSPIRPARWTQSAVRPARDRLRTPRSQHRHLSPHRVPLCPGYGRGRCLVKRSGLIALSFAALALPAVADTIYFKDGASLSGTVLREDTTHVVLKLPQGRMTFPVEDVERVEEDDNPPSAKPAPPDTPMDAEEPAPALRELDKEDRRRLRLMLNDLLSTDAAARNAARQRIERFGQDRDLFPFLE